MRQLISLLIILAASVYLGVWLMQHPGTVTILMHPWLIEMPLWFALTALVVLLFIFYFCIDFIDHLQLMWFRIKNWWRFRREHRLSNKTQHGLTLLIEGRYKKAERLLLAGIHQSVDPLMNYLSAARAARELKANERSAEYLQKARKIAPHAELAIGLTEAEIDLTHEKPRHAAEILERLLKMSPRHPRILSLLEKAYVRLAEWQRLLALLPNMRKARILTSEQFALFEKNVYCEIIKNTENKTLPELEKLWYSLPRHVRKNPDVVLAYVKKLLQVSAFTQIEELIRSTLRNHWQPELVAMYGTLPFVNLNRQLVIVGAWLKMYGDQQPLLLTLGRLCARIQLYGKAKEYFDRSLELGADRETLLTYAALLEELHETDAAMKKYRLAAGVT